MLLTHQDQGQLTVMSLKGEFTAEETDRFRRAAIERMDAHVRDFVLDLTQLESIDSQGLETLLWLQEECIERLGQVRLAGATDALRTVLDVTRLASRFEQTSDVPAAIRSLT